MNASTLPEVTDENRAEVVEMALEEILQDPGRASIGQYQQLTKWIGAAIDCKDRATLRTALPLLNRIVLAQNGYVEEPPAYLSENRGCAKMLETLVTSAVWWHEAGEKLLSPREKVLLIMLDKGPLTYAEIYVLTGPWRSNQALLDFAIHELKAGSIEKDPHDRSFRLTDKGTAEAQSLTR